MDAKDFIKNVHLVAKEKEIDEEIIFEGMEQALITAYKRNYNSKTNVKPKINRETGEIKIFTYYVVMEDYEDPEVTIDEEKVLKWLNNGAEPTDTVRNILSNEGIWAKFKASKTKSVKSEPKKKASKKEGK